VTRPKLSEAQLLDWLRLTRSENVGPITFRNLINRYGSASAALEALPELSRAGGLKRTIKICSIARAEAEIETVRALGARHVALNEKGYPDLLHHIDSPPPILTIKGREDLAHQSIFAVVGARNASAVGVKLTTNFVKDLGESGLIIASGLARGIDTAAHTAALNTGTIGVVAGGIDCIYPKENAALQSRIAEQGLLIAEFPPGVSPKSQHFPRRNRLVSGISLGVLVVEAALRSGSLITARLAGEQGREVFAVPGSPLDPRAGGTNRLLQDGAQMVLSGNDILSAFETFSNPSFIEPQDDFIAGEDHIAGEGHRPKGDHSPSFDADARTQIVNLLSITPIEVDELIRQSEQHAATVQTVLIELELAGRLIRHNRQLVSLGS
jgi:DNA processing protein